MLVRVFFVKDVKLGLRLLNILLLEYPTLLKILNNLLTLFLDDRKHPLLHISLLFVELLMSVFPEESFE